MNAGLYRMKPAVQRMTQPLVDVCLSRGVSADALTLAAIPAAALGGLGLALADEAPVLLLAIPFLAGLRLILNLIDGQVARQTGTTHALGEVLNEVGDRISDVLFIGGLAFVAVVGPMLALSAVLAALLASFVGVAARAVGTSRQYGGVMSKPGRMIVLAVAAPLALLLGDARPLAAAAWIILAGSLLTSAQRLMATREAFDALAARGKGADTP